MVVVTGNGGLLLLGTSLGDFVGVTDGISVGDCAGVNDKDDCTGAVDCVPFD